MRARARAARPVPTPMPTIVPVGRVEAGAEEVSVDPAGGEESVGSVNGGRGPSVGSRKEVLVEVMVEVVGGREVIVITDVMETVSRAPMTLRGCVSGVRTWGKVQQRGGFANLVLVWKMVVVMVEVKKSVVVLD